MKTRTFTHDEILNSKGYVKNYSHYPTPQELYKPLLDNRTKSFKNFEPHTITGSYEDINTNEDETENISFGRLHLSKQLTIDNDLFYRVGIIHSFDKNKPIVKIYSGVHVTACTNMCVFGADQIKKFDIQNNPLGYITDFKRCFEEIDKKIQASISIINQLKAITFSKERVNLLNGKLLRNTFVNNEIAGTNPIINAIKLQTTKGHKYYVENEISAWLYYNSLTEYLNEKVHILDVPEKALSLFAPLQEEIKAEMQTVNEIEVLALEEVNA